MLPGEPLRQDLRPFQASNPSKIPASGTLPVYSSSVEIQFLPKCSPMGLQYTFKHFNHGFNNNTLCPLSSRAHKYISLYGLLKFLNLDLKKRKITPNPWHMKWRAIHRIAHSSEIPILQQNNFNTPNWLTCTWKQGWERISSIIQTNVLAKYCVKFSVQNCYLISSLWLSRSQNHSLTELWNR